MHHYPKHLSGGEPAACRAGASFSGAADAGAGDEPNGQLDRDAARIGVVALLSR